METASEVLLIIVSSVLAVFLILASIALVMVIRLQRRVNDIVSSAEKVAGSMEAAASAFERTAAPLAFVKLVSKIVTHIKRKEK